MYKMLALALDDTLLMPDLSIPGKVVEALRGLIKKGVLVTLATGRMFPSAEIYARQIGITAPLVTYNGAMIRRAGEKDPVRWFPVDMDVMREMIELAAEKNWYLQLYNDDSIIVKSLSEETAIDPDLRLGACREVGDLRKAQLGPTPKMMTVVDPALSAEREAWLEERFADRLHITRSKPFLLEMMAPGVSKANSLQLLAEENGITAAEAVTCGDSDNDLEMLDWAGMGCCMANGLDTVKQNCNYVAKKERAWGVLEVMEKFF